MDFLEDGIVWIARNARVTLIIFWSACVALLIFALIKANAVRKKKGSWRRVLFVSLLAGGLPIFAGLVTFLVFFVMGAASTAQFNAGDTRRMDGWSLWVDAFLICFFGLIVWSAGNLIWFLVSVFNRRYRSWMLYSAAAFVLSLAGWCIVVAMAPTA